jgi:hypothetical protein
VTDDAKSGVRNGLIALIMKTMESEGIYSSQLWLLLVISHERLVQKVFGSEYTITIAVSQIHLIKLNALNHRQFQQLLTEN